MKFSLFLRSRIQIPLTSIKMYMYCLLYKDSLLSPSIEASLSYNSRFKEFLSPFQKTSISVLVFNTSILFIKLNHDNISLVLPIEYMKITGQWELAIQTNIYWKLWRYGADKVSIIYVISSWFTYESVLPIRPVCRGTVSNNLRNILKFKY